GQGDRRVTMLWTRLQTLCRDRRDAGSNGDWRTTPRHLPVRLQSHGLGLCRDSPPSSCAARNQERCHMSRLYGPVHRSLQDRFETRRLADNVETRVVLTEIPQEHKAFIESRDMFFLSTIDHQGRPTVSYKGGDPGFAKKLPLTQRTPSVSCKLLRRSKADGNEDQQLFHL